MGNAYVYIAVSISAVALASFSMYDQGTQKASRFALGIILFAALISPITSAVSGLLSIDFNDTGGYVESSAVDKTLQEAFCEGIRRTVAEGFSLKADCVAVGVSGFDCEKMSADKIFVTLSGSAALTDIRAVESFVSDLGVGKCILEVRLG